ncbi:phenylalanine--tRNA ligase subunit beta, partial [Streptococcus porcinus]
ENDLKQRTYVFELNYDKLMNVSVGYINYEQIPKYPGVTRDIALEVDTIVSAAELVSTIKAHGGKIFQDAQVFDVYEGEHMEEGKKPVAIRISYLDTENTLTDEQVTAVHDEIVNALTAEGAVIR